MARNRYDLSEYNKTIKTMPLEMAKEKIYSKFGDLIKIDEETYKNGRTKARFIDRDFGEWWIEPTLLINRGSKHPDRARREKKIPLEEVLRRLSKSHGNKVILDISTYVDTHKKARFIDYQLGEFWSVAKSVLAGADHPKRQSEKLKKTMIERYGADNPNRVHTIALKIAKSSNNSVSKFHWRTNKELACVGSYEVKTVDYLNENKIDFNWQPTTFIMPDGKTYRPDLFLVEENKWIEIKGWMRKDAQEKWDWFISQYPNSELWTKKELLERGIYVK